MSTPDHTVLIVAPIAGFVLALALAIALKRRSTSAGYDGAGFKIYIRGTEVVAVKKLSQMCTEKGKAQIDVAGVPMPTNIENLHLLLNGATGSDA
ncbi:hypothetical protein G6F65_021938 [Rhizopus arrhizus]|nr:hypothetical protein G6F65_021938 [Rhizopus arrhizus]